MKRKIVTIERSPLARNVYSILLSKLDEVEIISIEEEGVAEKLVEDAKDSSLLVVNHNMVGDKKDELQKLISKISGELKVPCVIFVGQGMTESWRDFENIDNTVIMERPFFPDEFLDKVETMWGVK